MKKNLDNRELNIINRFLHGDHEAYSLLYKEHVQELFSYGKALTSNDERLKDAIQDVFYKILSNPSSLKNVQNLKYFLFKSLKNRLIDILKSEINKEAVYERIDFTVNDVTILDSLIEEEERFELSQKIKLLLEQLTFRQREAVCLRYIYNMEYEEMLDLLNMNNSKSQETWYLGHLNIYAMKNQAFSFYSFYTISQILQPTYLYYKSISSSIYYTIALKNSSQKKK